jgi:CHAT domain-containing protein
MGSKSLIASVIPVPDAAVSALMRTLHRYLRAGRSPAAALAAAQRSFSAVGPAERVTAAAFLCFGAG